ncbi:MAG: methyl-accepting chemotaxis protein [Sulfurospirillaceae bacterium]|nr:methyl-accepting chemotaxis protein [Sulfurospirillaceae bacterium]
MSFKTKITLTICALMFASLSIFGIFSYIDTKKNSVLQTESSLQMASRALTDYIDLWISTKKKGVESTAKSLKDIDVMAISDLIERLRDVSTMLGALDSYVGLEDGSMTWGSGKKKPAEYDPRARPWYIKAKETKKLGMTDAYLGATTQKMMVTIMAPVFNGTDFLGVFGIDIALDDLAKALGDINFNGGYGTLQDTKGVIVAHPKKEFLGKDLAEIAPDLAKQLGNKTEGLIDYTMNGSDKVLAFKISTETGWRPSITFDKSTAYAFLDTQVKSLFFMGIMMLILSLGIVIFVIKMLLKPLDRLNFIVQELSSSEGDLRQRLEAKSHDEFGQVSHNINKFIEKLHDIVKNSKSISSENASISEELSRTAQEVVRNADGESRIVSNTKEEGISLTKSIEASVEKAKASQVVLIQTQKDIGAVKNKVEHLENTMQITAS